MRIRHFIYAAVALAFMLASCDTVDTDDRYIYVEPPQIDLPPDNADENDITEAKLAVLIEDFTGQNCPNCPLVVPIIESLEEQYPGLVIAVGVHSGPLGIVNIPGIAELRTDIGDEYYVSAGSPSQPAVSINRADPIPNWRMLTGEVSKILGLNAPMWLRVNNSYDADSRKLSIEVRAKGFAAVSGNLQLWLVEDGIVGYQKDGTNVTLSYVHNHVFRAAVNGTWGEPFSIGQDEIQSVTCEIALDAGWNADNMSVVAFVYNKDGVQQVTKAPVVVETATEPEEGAETE